MNCFLRPTSIAAWAVCGLAAWTSTASAGVEIGGSAGIHVFSDSNELGVNDVPNANSVRNSAVFAARVGVFFTPIFGVEGEFGVIPSEARETVFDVLSLTYRVQAVAQFPKLLDPKGRVVPFALIGGGALQIVDNGGAEHDAQIAKDTDALLFLGAGVKYRVDNGWGLRLDLRVLFPPSSQSEGFTEDFEALLSFYKELGRAKPAKPAPPPVDNDPDQDGILSAADQCPTEPEDKDGFQDDDGCVDNDNDSDAIADAADQCPTEPEDKDGFQDDDGCPDNDNDSDAIADAADQCPTEPEDKDGFQDDDGCPDPDNDGDGVLDAADQCPTEPETKNGFQDDDGCPDELPQPVKRFSGVIQGINFRAGDARLLPSSNATLDRAVAVLQEYGDLRLEIQGHTDDDQSFKRRSQYGSNDELSQARAESVKAYFVSKGIDESRLTAKGYGETVPVEDPRDLKGGKLRAARAKNRRVEFKLISELTQTQQPQQQPPQTPQPQPPQPPQPQPQTPQPQQPQPQTPQPQQTQP